MAGTERGLRVCPTRIDGREVLFAHQVTLPMCQQRQRGHYHKCFTCAHNNAYAGRNGSAKGVDTARPVPMEGTPAALQRAAQAG